jgi:uncharacterized Rmd1/YagE family protein
MRLTGYCTAESYRISPLFSALEARGLKPILMRDTIHISYNNSFAEHCDVFLFPFGTAIFWGLEDTEEADFLKYLRPFEISPLAHLEFDELSFTTGTTLRISKDEITLPFPSAHNKLAVSYSIAQSVKLTVFETTVRSTIEKTKHLPEEIVRRGKVVLSRSEIAKTIGQLFLERSSINLHTDILDTPEIFWEYPENEPPYRMVANYLDIQTRVDVLNKRLNIVKELLEMLSTELNHRHSSRLEWIIIVLIFFEIILAFGRDVLLHLGL